MKPSLAAIAAMTLSVSAFADDLATNLTNTVTGVELLGPGRKLAASFASGTSAHTLTAVTVRLANPNAGSLTASIYRDGGLHPGTVLGDLAEPSSYPATLGLVTFRSGGIELTANTTYWVVLEPVSGDFDWAWTSDSSGSGPGFSPAWGVTDEPSVIGGGWATINVYPLQMNVVVDACVCPADINCDLFVDFFDYDAFVGAFEAGSAIADFNGDGFIDFFDYDAYVQAFEAGC